MFAPRKRLHRAVVARIADASIAILAAAVRITAQWNSMRENQEGQRAADDFARSDHRHSGGSGQETRAKELLSDLLRKQIRGGKRAQETFGENADLIVANDVTAEGAGFDQDTNIVNSFLRDGRDLRPAKIEQE